MHIENTLPRLNFSPVFTHNQDLAGQEFKIVLEQHMQLNNHIGLDQNPTGVCYVPIFKAAHTTYGGLL